MFMPEIKDIQVVVLMGGLGSRLGERTKTVPKPMLPVSGKPFFFWQLDLMKKAGFRKFLFLIGYRAQQVESYFRDGSDFGVEIKYSRDGATQLGTAGAIRNAWQLLEQDFLLIYGDSFMDIDYFEVVYRYFLGKISGKTALMTVLHNQGKFDESNVQMLNGEIVKYKKHSHDADLQYIDYGVGLYEKEIFQKLSADTFCNLDEIQHKLVESRKMSCCIVRKRFYEIGIPAAYEEFEKYVMQRYQQDNKVVFFDRDGVINEIVYNEETEQLDSPLSKQEVILKEDTIQAMESLENAGFLLFVVTNQPAAAKGKVTLETLYDINRYIMDSLEERGVHIKETVICPHHPKDSDKTKERFLIRNCKCRKPDSGMLEQILAKYRVDCKNSWMIGDSYTDILAGKKAGVRTAFLGCMKCDMCQKLAGVKPDIISDQMDEISEAIIYEMKERTNG